MLSGANNMNRVSPGSRILAILVIAAAVLLAGCANSVLTLMKVSQHEEPVVPNTRVVEQELKGRAFQVGKVYTDPTARCEIPVGYSDGFFAGLLRRQLEKGFANAAVTGGIDPARAVDIAIEEMIFTKGMFLIPVPSILRVRLEINNSDGRALMKGEFESRYLPTAPAFLGGTVTALAVPTEGWVAAAKLIPSVAVAITKTIAGLQLGKGLSEIEIYPKAFAVGSVITPGYFLEGSPYGLAELTRDELNTASQLEK